MNRRSDIFKTSVRLLNVKKVRGLGAYEPDASEQCSTDAEIACVNCGYRQHDQPLDRCPECGLTFASRLRDPTPWTTPLARPLGWWETARKVWLWDHRIRLRTSYLPATPESASFANWSIIASALLLGLALATLNFKSSVPGLLPHAAFVIQTFVGTVLSGLLLLGGVHGLTIAIQGTWRRRLRFIPSSIHYATAWWPLLSLFALVGCALYLLEPQGGAVLLMCLLLLVPATWGLWLWGSVTESEHIRYVAARISAVALCLCICAGGIILAVPGSSRLLLAGWLNRTGASLLKLNILGTYSANPVQAGPRTFALFLDVIPSGDEDLISLQISRLGAANCVSIRNRECTLEQIEKAFATARIEIRPQDKFILYINGHGAAEGSGAIRMADGELTSQKLAGLLSWMPTKHCLVIIDSCFGGKFISALNAASCDALVITASDDRNVAFKSGLRDFWLAFDKVEYDSNRDGKVTVDEAFQNAFRSMLKDSDQLRKEAIAGNTNRPREKKLLEEKGFATPQIDLVGDPKSVDRKGFAVPLPAKPAK